MRNLRTIFFALTVAASAGVAAVGCGGDDDVTPATTTDGGKDGSVTPDADMGDTNQPPPDAGTDATRDFAVYVIDLITNQTKETNAPTPDLCPGCTDKQDQAQFKPLFP